MDNDVNIQHHKIDPYVLIDELSETEIYIGTSKSFPDKSKPYWRIKRILKIGNVWQMEHPEGNQDFKFVWDDRYSYMYR